jgi:hypothetical protein
MSSPRLFKQIFAPATSSAGAGFNQYTTITAGSNNVPLPTGTINVVSTAGFPTSGQLGVQTLTSLGVYAYVTVTYTNTNATQFLGCTGGANTIFTGYQIGAIGSISVGSWICPAGIKYVILTGCGGGGGGGAGGSSSGRSQTNFAYGGSGGWAAPTITQVVAVTPGVSYPISVGQGGIGGTNNCVANIVSGGGSRAGNPGADGAASIFGSLVLPGGKGGKEGGLISINSLSFATGSDCSNAALTGTANPAPQVVQSMATPGGFFATGYVQGVAHSVNRAANQYSVAGGGHAGGVSNNPISTGGNGGQGAQGFDGYPFAVYGISGTWGGGGGGGGGGENWDFNNTHEGGLGGWGGAGFIEISWVA